MDKLLLMSVLTQLHKDLEEGENKPVIDLIKQIDEEKLREYLEKEREEWK